MVSFTANAILRKQISCGFDGFSPSPANDRYAFRVCATRERNQVGRVCPTLHGWDSVDVLEQHRGRVLVRCSYRREPC